MLDIAYEYYNWWRGLHIIAVITWMAGLFYLPRLFVYHAKAAVGSELSETFKVMERRLYKAIMLPSLVTVVVFGTILMFGPGVDWSMGWIHAKLVLVLLMVGFHLHCNRWRKDFAADANRHSERYYRVANEVPTVLLLLIVFLVVIKPF